VAKSEVPIREEDTQETKVLCLKLLICPEEFTLADIAKLQELMENEGCLE